MGKAFEIVGGVAQDIAKPVYEDAVQPAARVTGKALSTVLNCFNMLLAPLERAQLSSAAKTEAFRKSLEIKYELIPPEERKEPELKVVYQIADKLKYNLDSDELREMFENLLISSMTRGRAVHPLFADIVDKMTVEDAVLFEFVCNAYLFEHNHPAYTLHLAEIHCWNDQRGYFLCWTAFSGMNREYCDRDIFLQLKGHDKLPLHENARLHVETLEKMGLIKRLEDWDIHGSQYYNLNDGEIETIPHPNPIAEKIDFKGIVKRPDIHKWIMENRTESGDSVSIDTRTYILTVFGMRLCEALQSPNDNREWHVRY